MRHGMRNDSLNGIKSAVLQQQVQGFLWISVNKIQTYKFLQN